MDYFLTFIVGFVFGWLALQRLIRYRMRNLNKILEEAQAKSKNEDIMVNFVRVESQIYAYNADTDEFLAQGTCKADIVGQLEKRWPGTSFRASPTNLKEVNLE
jgi:GMP synthase PP-ATPase subunit